MGFHPFDRGRARPSQRQIDQVFDRVAAALRRDDAPEVRYEAAYALSHWYEPRAAKALLDALSDPRESARLRGQCAEGLGLVLECAPARARAVRARAVAALLRAVQDADAELRFWSVYALGNLRAREARATLERLAAEDRAVCPNMWRVGEEAADALQFWDTGVWPEARVPGRAGVQTAARDGVERVSG